MKELYMGRGCVLVCGGSHCGKYRLRKALKQALREAGLKKEIEVLETDCTGHCHEAPVLGFSPGNQWFGPVREPDLGPLLKKHIAPC